MDWQNYSNILSGYPYRQYRLDISDSTYRNFSVIVHDEPGKIGHEYKFRPFKGKLVKPGYDEADLHYFRKTKEPIPEGTEVVIDTWWMNFYGSYYRVEHEGHTYDIKTNSIEFDMDSFLGKDRNAN